MIGSINLEKYLGMHTEKLNEYSSILKEIEFVESFFKKVINIIPSFDIASPDILPYGLKPHTRSVSWILEQVIVQQAKYNATKLNIIDVNFNLPDTCLHDCVVKSETHNYFVNIKVSSSEKNSKNDIAAVEKLYKEYISNSQYSLIYVVFQFEFDNINIKIDTEKVHAFSPQFLPIYVNPRNDKIQAKYHSTPEYRTREDFLNLLKEKSTSIIL